MDCILWIVDCGLWTVDCGLWNVNCGLWTVDCGLWIADCGLRIVDCGLWTVVCVILASHYSIKLTPNASGSMIKATILQVLPHHSEVITRTIYNSTGMILFMKT